MNKNNQYGTMLEAIEELNKRGFTENFRLVDDNLYAGDGHSFRPLEVNLLEFHRFEGLTNPSDMSIVYAIETDSGKKGTLVDAFGVNGSPEISDFLKQVKQIED